MFNWLSLVSAIPTVIMGIQAIHGSAVAGATKKQLALEALGLAAGTTEQIDPTITPTVNAVGSLIDNFVSLFHAQNAPGFGANSSPAVPPAAIATPTTPAV